MSYSIFLLDRIVQHAMLLCMLKRNANLTGVNSAYVRPGMDCYDTFPLLNTSGKSRGIAIKPQQFWYTAKTPFGDVSHFFNLYTHIGYVCM